jgi:hypothetical protein
VEGKGAAILTPEGVSHIGVRVCRNSQYTVVSWRAAELYGLEKRKLKRPLGIMGPSGTLTYVEEDYEVLFPAGGPRGGRLKVTAYRVDTLEEYCGVPKGSLREWEI